MNGVYLRRHTPDLVHLISNSSIKTSFYTYCSTKARFILTNDEGLSITVCPASKNSVGNSFVEIFSSGWDKFNQFKDSYPIRSISIEYIHTDEEEDEYYSFTWFEIVPRLSLGLVGEYK